MKLLLVSFHLFLCACAVPLERIANGQDAERNQFPYEIYITTNFGSSSMETCGGSIISPTWILTAASCNVSLQMDFNYTITAGILDLNEPGEKRDVAELIMHPGFGGYAGIHNIALLKLAQPLTFSESIQPVALPEAGATPEGEVIASGWGHNEKTILQYAQVPIITYAECVIAFEEITGFSSSLNERDICTGPLPAQLCSYMLDEGGPLVQEGVLLGVMAWQYVPCIEDQYAPLIYTRVSDNIDFILEHVDDLPGTK